MYELVIEHGTVILEDSSGPLDIAISEGRIAALLSVGQSVEASRTLDATGLVVLPGAIDTHTHVRWPFDGRVTVDNFASASEAAAIGGTTTIIDFVPVKRGSSFLEAAENRVALAASQSAIDFGFHPILNSASSRALAEIKSLVDAGFASFKMYTVGDENGIDDGETWSLMRAIAEAGGLPGFHAENSGIVASFTEQQLAAGNSSLLGFAASRPPLSEALAIASVCRMARELDSPVYIFHMSGKGATDAMAEARAFGTRTRGETCTHYLAFTARELETADGWKYTIVPPLRDDADQEALWRRIADGTIVSIASDHVAYSSDQKSTSEAIQFLSVPTGAPGIDARVTVLWNLAVASRRFSAVEFAQIMSTRPAKAMGLYPRKGTIKVGSDADLTLIDPVARWIWPPDDYPALTDYSPYSGVSGIGIPKVTVQRGQVIAEDGRFVGRSGAGVFVARAIDPRYWLAGDDALNRDSS